MRCGVRSLSSFWIRSEIPDNQLSSITSLMTSNSLCLPLLPPLTSSYGASLLQLFFFPISKVT